MWNSLDNEYVCFITNKICFYEKLIFTEIYNWILIYVSFLYFIISLIFLKD